MAVKALASATARIAIDVGRFGALAALRMLLIRRAVIGCEAQPAKFIATGLPGAANRLTGQVIAAVDLLDGRPTLGAGLGMVY